MVLEENVNLSKYTSLHVGGPARYFVHAKTDTDVIEGVAFAVAKGLPYMALGKGSNTLFSDDGYPGVIVHMEDRALSVKGTCVTAASGVFMRPLINFCLTHSLRGLEDLAGIPGTVGGAVRGNAGTWSTEIKDCLASVDVFVPPTAGSTGEVRALTQTQCDFGYRHSIFKKHPTWIILRATFNLELGDAVEGQQIVQKDLLDRHAKQPYNAPSAGSVFKNLESTESNKPLVTLAKGGSAPQKLAVGQLIELCGLKGLRIGGAEISTKHANFILNRDKAKSQDILDLIHHIQETVQQKYSIQLVPEIEIVEKR